MFARHLFFKTSTSFSHLFNGSVILYCTLMLFFFFLLFLFKFLGIIKCVTLTTLYMNSMWWPPYRSMAGMIHQAIFLILSALSAFNYAMATTTGPGFLPLKWEPKVIK